jgi:hypothetical protein
MKNTRREFSLFGLGATLLSGARTGVAKESTSSARVLIHEDPKLSSFEVNLAGDGGSGVVATFGRAVPGLEAGEIAVARSVDGGETWSRAVSLFRGEGEGQLHQLAGITRLSGGRLVAASTRFSFLFEGKLRWRRGTETSGVFLRQSTNGGSGWGELRKVDTAPFRSAWTRGSIVEMPDGSLLLPLAGQKGETYAGVGEPIASFIVRSTDGAKTWQYLSTIARDSAGISDYDEPAMVSLGGARLLCVLRSHQSPRKDPPGGYLHTTVSEDGGVMWGEVQKTSMWGHPANLLRLQDGRILCTFGYRMHPNPGVRGCVSEDGVQWKPENIFAVKEIPNLGSHQLQIGCPSSVQLGDGRILTAYQVWTDGPGSRPRQRIDGSLYRV